MSITLKWSGSGVIRWIRIKCNQSTPVWGRGVRAPCFFLLYLSTFRCLLASSTYVQKCRHLWPLKTSRGQVQIHTYVLLRDGWPQAWTHRPNRNYGPIILKFSASISTLHTSCFVYPRPVRPFFITRTARGVIRSLADSLLWQIETPNLPLTWGPEVRAAVKLLWS